MLTVNTQTSVACCLEPVTFVNWNMSNEGPRCRDSTGGRVTDSSGLIKIQKHKACGVSRQAEVRSKVKSKGHRPNPKMKKPGKFQNTRKLAFVLNGWDVVQLRHKYFHGQCWRDRSLFTQTYSGTANSGDILQVCFSQSNNTYNVLSKHYICKLFIFSFLCPFSCHTVVTVESSPQVQTAKVTSRVFVSEPQS